MPAPPFRDVEFPPVDLEVERRADGTILLTPRQKLEIGFPSVPLGLAHQAALQPDKPHLKERGPDGDWTAATFAEMKRAADGVAQWLLDRRLAGGGAMLIVSGNSIAHAVMRYGAMAAGVPVAPISENYALLGAAGGFQRLRYMIALIRPTIVFAERVQHVRALAGLLPDDVRIVSREPDDAGLVAYDEVVATVPRREVDESIAGLTTDSVAAYMCTSGSTGRPKAVIQTHGMIVANLFQGWQVLGRAAGWDDVLLEWLPWSHVSGAFSSMAAAIFGGTFHIDGGKPLPGLFDETIRNLREVPLKYFTNVPAGYAMLVPALERDPKLRETFFSELRLMLYGGAGLPQPLYDRLQALAVETVGKRIFFTTGYGATETTSGCMSIYFESEQVGIGLPMPGLMVKLVPIGDRYELRMKGPMVTPGYLGDTDGGASLRDEEGFYRIGDAATFHDPDDPARGLAFAGRLSEEFKLETGTWVPAGPLRAEMLKRLAPLAGELLLCGENRSAVGILAWPNLDALRAIAADPEAEPDALLRDPAVLAEVGDRLAAHNREYSASSMRIARFAFLADRPDAEAHELSDKGTVNQRLAKQRRADEIDQLYSAQPHPGVVCLERSTAGVQA